MNRSIYIAGALKAEPNGLPTASDLKQKLSPKGYEVKEIQSTRRNVWCRDFMPLRSVSGKWVQFVYKPSYMAGTEKWEKRIPVAADIHRELALEVESSELKLDGGAMEIFGAKGIVSDRVFRENKGWEMRDVIGELRSRLGLEELFVVPQDPYDFTGHVDGMVRFVDAGRVVVNDRDAMKIDIDADPNRYRRRLMDQWYYAFHAALAAAGLEVEDLPCTPVRDQKTSSARGYYINFLRLPDCIAMPTYNDPAHDEKARRKLEELYGLEVIGIDATTLSEEGGAVNCVTWGN